MVLNAYGILFKLPNLKANRLECAVRMRSLLSYSCRDIRIISTFSPLHFVPATQAITELAVQPHLESLFSAKKRIFVVVVAM